MSDAGTIGVGVIGTGFMGQAHALAYRAAPAVFADVARVRLEAVADPRPEAARAAARRFGFLRHTADWRALVADPAVRIVCITTPNALHREMALAAAAAGKHVHCEKPLAPSVADARAMVDAAERAGVKTAVGYNYLRNPLLALAREMVDAGELGEITGFRGVHAEDFMADPAAPHGWRLDPGGGALADLGSHILAVARHLLGPIAAVCADLETVVARRPMHAGAAETREVAVDDVARVLLRFGRGCRGAVEANWLATGRKMHLAFELTGTRGSLAFTQERMNELLHFRAGADPRTAGFTRIEAGPQHPPYGLFCVAPGHQLGFNDLKTIEAAGFLRAVAGGEDAGPNFRDALEIQRVIEAAVRSSREGGWLDVA